MARKPKSWWRVKKIRHRDAVILASLSAASLLAANAAAGPIQTTYVNLVRVVDEPLMFIFVATLSVLAYLTYFAGILVLVGGVNFMWGYIDRGRYLLGLGVGLSFIGLARQIALFWLTTGTPVNAVIYMVSGLGSIGLLIGFASYTLMSEYALMIKKRARSAWRRWSRTRGQVTMRGNRPVPRGNGRSNGRSPSRRTMRS